MTDDKGNLNRRSFVVAASQFAAFGTLAPAFCRAALRDGVSAYPGKTPVAAAASQNVYSVRELSEGEILQTYQQILTDACIYGATVWTTAAFDPQAGFWGEGTSGERGIRSIASMALACATLIRFGESVDKAIQSDLLNKSLAAIRYTTATHRTGSSTCPDGKQWGATPGFGPGSWQSGMWAGMLALGSWLIWDRLGPELQQSLQRVIEWECDILFHRPPPNGLWLDTKAEENGWEVPCLVLGTLMFPSHPHASEWEQTAHSYMMNTLCTEADTRDSSLVDGRPVNEWVKGANLQPDFTLENHNIFHPAYVACSCYFLTQAAMYLTYAHRPVPQSASHHLFDTWHMLQTVLLPWGEAACPQGMDWELHGLTYVNLYAALATKWGDPLAACLEQRSLQYQRAWQEMSHGSLTTPGSAMGFGRHAATIDQISYGFFAHKIYGAAVRPVSTHDNAANWQGVHDYPYVDFIAHRTQKKFASFSWKNRIMGLLIPVGTGHEGNPCFTVPIQNGFVGEFEVDPVGDSREDKKIVVVDHERRKTADGFETTGTILVHSGRLQQKIKMVSIGSQIVIYEDEVTALVDITVKKELGIPFGIENDEITGGTRVVVSRDARKVVHWRSSSYAEAIKGDWVNVDGRLGIVSMAGSGLYYAQGSGYLPGISVYADNLYGSYSDRPRRFRAGEIVARRLAVFLVEVTPQQTSGVAESCRIEEHAGAQMLRFKQPDDKDREIRIAFGRLTGRRAKHLGMGG